ncbi:MAG: TylF/MycF/NovP-related O-methyltransferase [Pseudomonadota bacterium]
MAVFLEQVQKAFQPFGLLDDQVVFVKSWFKDTLHLVEAKRISLIRLDGDMNESTIQAIEALYPRLAKGGFIVVDDYGGIKACAKAINDYRDAHGIDD